MGSIFDAEIRIKRIQLELAHLRTELPEKIKQLDRISKELNNMIPKTSLSIFNTKESTTK